MGRSPRISEGKCAAYGRDPPNASAPLSPELFTMIGHAMPASRDSSSNPALALALAPAAEAERRPIADGEVR